MNIAIWKWVAGIVLVLALLGAGLFLPVKDWVQSFQRWIEGLGAWGFLVFGGAYVLATLLLVPVSVLTIAAGLAFGLARGFALVVVSATIGATLAFLVARYFAHDRVESFVARRPRFKAVHAAVSEEGWKIVALLRLSPVVPFNLQNYFYGVTNVTVSQYVAATFVGIMPGTLLYVYLGSAGQAAGGERGVLEWGFFAAGLIATLAIVVVVTFKARSKLKEHGVGSDTGKKKAGRKKR